MDPWDWSVDDVVGNLCHHSGYLWADRPNSASLDKAKLEAILREHEINGSCLLTDVDVSTLKDDLGIKAVGQRSMLLHAIKKLQDQSFKWRTQQAANESRKRQINDLASIASPEPTPPHFHDHLLLQQPFGTQRDTLSPFTSQTLVQQPPETPLPRNARARSGEVLVESLNGASKRRKVAPQLSIQPVTTNENFQVSSNEKQRQQQTTDLGTQQSRGAYHGRKKLLASEIIYGSAKLGDELDAEITSDDEEFSFVSQPQRFVPGRRSFVDRCLRKRFQAEPKLIRPGEMQLLPLPERLGAGRPPATLFKMIAPDTAVVVKHDSLLLRHAELGHSDTSLTADVGENVELDELLQRYPVQDSAEALPVYGESDSEISPEDLRDEMLQEREVDEEQTAVTSKNLSPQEVQEVIEEALDAFRENWEGRHLPVLESKARTIWFRKARPEGASLDPTRSELEHKKRLLAKYRQDISETQWTKPKALRNQCEIMEPTAKMIYDLRWKLELWSQIQPPPKRPKLVKERRQREKSKDDDSVELSDISDDTGDFIEDDEPEKRSVKRMHYGHPAKSSKISPGPHRNASECRVNDIDSVLGDETDEDEPMKGTDSVLDTDSAVQDEQVMTDAPTPTDRSRDSVLDSDNEPQSRDHLLPQIDVDDVDVIDLTQLPPSPPESVESPGDAYETPQSTTPEKHVKVERLPREVTPQPAPSTQVRASNFFEDPMRATRDDIRGWPLNEVVERGDRKRLLLKLLCGMDINLFTRFKPRALDLIKQGSSVFRFEVSRACGELRTRAGTLNGVSVEAYAGLVTLARLFVCWVDPDSEHFESEIIAPEALNETMKNAKNNISEFRDFLQKALSDDGAAARESDAEEIQNTPRKRKKKRKTTRSGQDLRDSALQRRIAGQEAAENIKLKLQSSDLREEDYEGHVINPETAAEDFICITKSISEAMLPHQVEGVRFLWREAVTGGHEGGAGCLLAHTMGLGKTMQTITFLLTIVDTLYRPHLADQIPKQLHPSGDAKFPRFLVLCPPTLLQNWQEEFKKWIPQSHPIFNHVNRIDSTLRLEDRFFYINLWYDNGGVLIVGYEMLRDLLSARKPFSEKVKQSLKVPYEEVLERLSGGADAVFADEAHKFKDPKSGISQAMARLNVDCRIALTGSPLANNLGEYYAMINWVAPNYLGSSAEFKESFQTPIEDGMYADSTRYEQRRSFKKLEALKEELDPKVSRKDITALRGDLKPKTEFVLRFHLTDLQFDAYTSFVQSLKGKDSGMISTTQLFDWIAVLTLLLYHPAVFFRKLLDRDAKRREQAQKNKTGKAKSPISEDGRQDVDVDPSKLDLSNVMLQRQREIFDHLPADYEGDVSLSPKTQFIEQIVKAAKEVGDKVLIFSHCRPVLDHLQGWLKRLNLSIARLDGSTPINDRLKLANEFNAGRYHLMLISTRAGGLGLNLPGANRVILTDFGFNPSWEEQAVGRAYRLGQTKPVFVYHLLYNATYEDPLHQRTVFKKQLSDRAVDKMKTKPVANKIHEFLFLPERSDEKASFEDHKGYDVAGLDAVGESTSVPRIHSITTTDIFHQADEDLNEEELREVKKDLEMWRLKSSDPVRYEQLKRDQELEQLRSQQALFDASRKSAGYASSHIPGIPQPPKIPPIPDNIPVISQALARLEVQSSKEAGAETTAIQPNSTDTRAVQAQGVVDLTGDDDALVSAGEADPTTKEQPATSDSGGESPPPKREP